MAQRDDFSRPVRRALAERAAYMCSNPACRNLTIGPHSDPTRSLSTGVAAHIAAAARGGPRYREEQTTTEREAIENAIWLCHSCSDLVDKDEIRFPSDLLLRWRIEHEVFVLSEGGPPKLPDLTITTLHGISLPADRPGRITGMDVSIYREHVLRIGSQPFAPIEHLNMRIQFPESIVASRCVSRPAGTDVVHKPDQMEFVVNISGGGSIESTGEGPASNYLLALHPVPPNARVEFRFISIEPRFNAASKLNIECFGEDAIFFYVEGEFQHRLRSSYVPRRFIAVLDYDASRRIVSARTTEEDDGSLKLIHSA